MVTTSFGCVIVIVIERKPVQEVFIILLTFQFRIALADCLPKSSAKADNLITTVKKRSLLEVDVHPNFRTFMEHKAFLSAWCRTFMHKREKNVFFLNDLKISLSPAPREGPFHVMFVKTSMDSESQDATNLTSVLTDSRIYSFMNMMTLYMRIVAIIFCSQYPTFLLFQCCDNVDIKPTGFCRINRRTKNSAEHAERIWNYFFESLAFSRHSVDLEFDEEVMEPERFTDATDHAVF